jgi:hypothetical protein
MFAEMKACHHIKAYIADAAKSCFYLITTACKKTIK